MKQIVVISGKGGTGKTVITASFAALSGDKVVADCDVDAADMHLLLSPEIKSRKPFKSGRTAVIDPAKCVKCGKCKEICRFDAVTTGFSIDPIGCEGCGFCAHVCPAGAIDMEENMTGEWYVSETRYGPMVHAKLGIAEENSGKLVSLVKSYAKELAKERGLELVLVDGSPGIGCPVIASIAGADMAVVVTEPSISGWHDADRVIKVAEYFKVPAKVIINKYDLNEDMCSYIEEQCGDNGVKVLGKIAFDEDVVRAMVQGKTIIEYADNNVTRALKEVWNDISSGW